MGEFRVPATPPSDACFFDVTSCFSDDLTLTQRIEYLSRAAMCAKSCTLSGAGVSAVGGSGGGGGDFLHEIEEKLEVAQLQLQIMDSISRLTTTDNTRRAVDALDRTLFDISEVPPPSNLPTI